MNDRPDDHPARAMARCPFCGQAIRRGEVRCPRCKLAQDERTRQSLGRLMGPWFVLDAANPSGPGVTWAKFCALIERGKVTPATVVRGPSSGGLWQRAEDTPSVATRLGLCWSCHAPLPPVRALTQCPACQAALNGPVDWPASPPPDQQPPGPAEGPGEEEQLVGQDEPAAWPAADAPGALDDLVRARPLAGGGSTAEFARPAGSAARRTVLHLSLALALGLVCLAAVWAALRLSRSLDSQSPRQVPAWEARPASPAPQPGDAAERTTPGGSGLTPEYLLPELPGGGDSAARPPGSPAPRSVPSPRTPRPGAMPGELFPEIPPSPAPAGKPVRPASSPSAASSDPLAAQRREAANLLALARKAEAAGDLRAAQDILVNLINTRDARALPPEARQALQAIQDKLRAASRPASEPNGEDLARQRASAEALYVRAAALRDRGNLMAAQVILVQVLNTCDRRAWPEGAQQALQDIQEQVRSASRPAEPSGEELAVQTQTAKELFDGAQRLIAQGNLLAAQKPLLEILNNHHPKAWPEGALQAFQQVQEAFQKSPSTKPRFFEVEPPR